MTLFLIALFVFLFGFTINMFYMSVLYHRALTHGAIELTPFAMKLVAKTGIWVTGVDPKTWICMHRLHHEHSDTDKDPHSPVRFGMFGVLKAQMYSYRSVLLRLIGKKKSMLAVVADLPFDVHYLTRRNLYLAPYFLQLTIAIAIGYFSHEWVIGLAYYLGMMSHPVQGWAVNSLAHRYGYQNFDNHDQSKNNVLVAWFIFGEGYQNNHHAHPERVNFGINKSEIDPGYGLCLIARKIGLLNFNELQPKHHLS